jgi:hypothetical protein
VVFIVGIPLAGLAFVCALLLKETPLHDTVVERGGAVEAVAQEAAAVAVGSLGGR